MSPPPLLVQISDPHIGAAWGGGDPEAGLAAVVEALMRLRPGPDAVVLSGDIADHAAEEEYERARELLEPLAVPLHVLPGNHDDRAALRRHFALTGAGGEPVQYAAALGPLRLVVLDTVRLGSDRGELDGARLAWLDAELALAPDAPTVIAMHHPPLRSGWPAADRIGLADGDREALAALLARHRQVQRLIAGHLHRTVVGEIAGRTFVAAPATYMRAELDLGSEELRFAAAAPGFAIHTLAPGELATHIEHVA